MIEAIGNRRSHMLLTSKNIEREAPVGGSGLLFQSDVGAAQVCVLSVGDEVTKTFVKQDSATVLKDRQKCLFYEVAEGIFVLRNNLRDTGQISFCNGEIEGSCHSRRRLRTREKKAASRRRCVFRLEPSSQGRQLFASKCDYQSNQLFKPLALFTHVCPVNIWYPACHPQEGKNEVQK